MSCVVGLRVSGGVWIGADSCISDGDTAFTCKTPKVFRKGPADEMLIGVVGHARYLDVLHYLFDMPAHPGGMGVNRYMTTIFAPALRKTLLDTGFTEDHPDGPDPDGVVDRAMLVGYRGRLFFVERAFAVIEMTVPYLAIGTQESPAYGALKILTDVKPPGNGGDIVRAALETAAYFSPVVSPPYKILFVHKERK